MGSSIPPKPALAASWQLTLALLHRCHHSLTSAEHELGHGTSFLSGIRVILSGRQLAGKLGWGLL